MLRPPTPPRPFHHLLLPLDGSHLAESTLPIAIAVGVRMRARVTLLHVLERRAPAAVHGDRHLTDAWQAEAYLVAIASRYSTYPVEIARQIRPHLNGDVSASIIEGAAALRADLIVLATHGAGNARRMLFGSVAQQVVGRGLLPVLLVRPADPSLPAAADGLSLRRILVPLDGTGPSEAALPPSASLAAAWDATVELVRVVPTLASVSGDRGGIARLTPSASAAALDMEEDPARAYLMAVAARVRADGLRATWRVARGDPAREVLEAARRSGADLLSIATHGRTGLDAAAAGSIASRIAAKYRRPLLLVRATPERPSGVG